MAPLIRRQCSLLAAIAAVALAVSLSATSVHGLGYLRYDYYSNTACRKVKDVVKAEVEREYKQNPLIVAFLLRIFFHDCFANGECDASLLIKENAVASIPTELSSNSNEGIRGLDFIDTLKQTVVNQACVGKKDLVSCADIIVLATRDAVSLATKRPRFAIKTGRLDAGVSLATSADTLPNPGLPIAATLARFKAGGFSVKETVILSGAHTVGESRSKFFDPDTAENATTRAALQDACRGGGEKRAFLDQGAGSAFRVDKSYFVMVEQGSGVLETDRDLKDNLATRAFVTQFANGPEDEFLELFEAALIKMSNLGAGSLGDIRKVCSVLN